MDITSQVIQAINGWLRAQGRALAVAALAICGLALVVNGAPQRLHTLLGGTRHTVLLFTGVDDQAQPAAELCRIADRIDVLGTAFVDAARSRPASTAVGWHAGIIVPLTSIVAVVLSEIIAEA